MATIFKKTYTHPLPAEAEIIQRRGKQIARWKDGRGNTQMEETTIGRDGKLRIVQKSPVYTARFRAADGVVKFITTGCREKQAAEKVLADLLGREEKIKSGILSSDESQIAMFTKRTLKEHVKDFLHHLEAKGCTEKHRRERNRYLRTLFSACGFQKLTQLKHGPVEKWMLQQQTRGVSARVRNAYRASLLGFCNWAVRDGRLKSNPFVKLVVANEKTDERRQRRPLSVDELERLIYVARLRPLAEYGRKSVPVLAKKKHGHATWKKKVLTIANIDAAYQRGKQLLADRPDFIDELEQRGRRNCMFCMLAAYTGLRKSELTSITLADVHLDGPVAYLELRAKNAKARRGAKIPLKENLVAKLRKYIETSHTPFPSAKKKLLAAPTLKTFNLDLATAGIAKVDDQGRSVDIHSLRHTFGTMLARAGVAPRTAQELMRHSKIDLTMNIYTHLELIDTAGAVQNLPDLQLMPKKNYKITNVGI